MLCAVGLGIVAIAGATTSTDKGIVDDETRAFTAECPAGERVEVGGFRSTVNTPSGILVEDLRFKGTRRWRASFDGLRRCRTGRRNRLLRQDVARDQGDRHRDRARGSQATPGRGNPTRGDGQVPRGKTVQLGGFAVFDEGAAPPPRGGPVSGFLPASMRTVSDRKWRVSGIAGFPGVKLTAVAGCADLPAPTAVTHKEPIEGGGSKTSAKAKCPRGEAVVMGGFKQTPYNGGGPYIRGLTRPDSRVWVATAWEFDEPASLTAIAYCA